MPWQPVDRSDKQHAAAVKPQRTCLVALLALLGMAPAYANSVTAGSIISKNNAIANASCSMPAGSQITGVKCTTIIRDLSARYRCTVQWIPAPSKGDG
jgi:hypothetical protein